MIPWVFGILACLIVAGVIASVSTASSVARIDENLRLFRNECRHEFDRQQYDINQIEDKLDAHIARTDRSGNHYDLNGNGGSGI